MVANGGEATARVLGGVVDDSTGVGTTVGLKREVVVGNLATVLLDALVDGIGHNLEALGDLTLQSLARGRDILLGTLLETLALGLTDLDGADNGLVQILLHALDLGTHEATVLGRRLLEGVGNLSDTLETNLELAVVRDNSVGESGELRLEVRLGAREGAGSGHASLSEGTLQALEPPGLTGLGSRHGGVQTASGLGEVLGSLTTVAGNTGTELAELLGCLVGKLLALSLGHGTVLTDERAESTAPHQGRGVTAVHDLLDAALLSVKLTVDADLSSLVGGNLSRDNSDLTLETSLLVLDRRDDASELSGESLLRLLHLVESSLAGSLHVLHSLGEASIVKRRALGDGRSQLGGGTGESAVGLSTVGGKTKVHLTELAVGRLAGFTEGASNGLQRSLVAADRCGIHAGDALLGSDLGSLDLVEQRLHVGLHLGVHTLGVLLELGCVGIHGTVGLRDLLGSLSLEGKEGTILVGHSILDSTNGTTLLRLCATLEGSTTGSIGIVGGAETGVELHEVAVGPLHGLLQVLLGESRDLVGDLHVHGSTSLAVHGLDTLLESEGV